MSQAYFVWASEVVAGLVGTNQALEEKLALEFSKRGVEIPKKI
jgi:hypothetical protein